MLDGLDGEDPGADLGVDENDEGKGLSSIFSPEPAAQLQQVRISAPELLKISKTWPRPLAAP